MQAAVTTRASVTWNWSHAGLGAAYALPAVLVTVVEPEAGLGLAVGVLCAAALGLPPRRRGRWFILVIGVLVAAFVLLGSVVSAVPVLAVATIAGLSLIAALALPSGRLGQLLLVLCLPIAGIGLSYGDVGDARRMGALFVAGSAYAWAVSSLWPDEPRPSRAPPPVPPRRVLIDYGVRLGLASGIAAAIGFALDLEHVGWACGACLLVMRPDPGQVRLRSTGRAAAVTVGAVAAAGLVALDPPSWVIAAATVVALAAMSATAGSGWYVTGGFTTFVVFLLLLVPSPTDAASRLGERIAETLLGVGLALVFGSLIPALRSRRRR